VILCNGRVRRIIGWMKPPTFVRPLLDSERQAIRTGLRSPDAFTLRRAQILLASADGRSPAQIADRLSCATQTVRNAIRAFQAAGIDCLKQRSHRPASAHSELAGIACERLRALLHRSPRDFGKPTSLWTLELVAHVAFAQGMTSRRMSGESVRQALMRMGIGWKRAKHWITSPDPAYLRKRGRATG
jgi:transposase